MSLLTSLTAFGLRQVIGDGVENIIDAVQQRFTDHSTTLPKALSRAHDRTWQAFAVALAGNGFLDRVKVFFASGDDKGVREQVQLFLQTNSASFDSTPAEIRGACLTELKRLRKSGVLSPAATPAAEVGRKACGFRLCTVPATMVEEAHRAVAGVADALHQEYPNLARLLRTPTRSGPPLLASAFAYFFRREVETDDELANGLFFDGLRQLSASQAKQFGEMGKAIDRLGERFEQAIEEVLQELERIRLAAEAAARAAAAAEKSATTAATAASGAHQAATAAHGAVLDVQAELQRLGGLHSAHGDEVRSLLMQVLQHLNQAGMQRGEMRPQHSCSIRGEDERRAVKALLARFRTLPPEEQKNAPALLNGLGKLQMGVGAFDGARQTFADVMQVVGDSSSKAEASWNTYRAAVEEKKWDEALKALVQAATLDPGRFAPFPLHRYEPKRILGAGGFGTAILCHDRNFAEEVVVKTIHAADLDRGVDDVFREARLLRRLSHPAIIGVHECDYSDPAAKARPYLVMDYFPGVTLQQLVDERGPLPLGAMLTVAVQVAAGMKAAHAQGVLHRDLKPANLLVRQESDRWKVKIIDFGLALRQQTVETSMLRSRNTEKSALDWSVAGTLDYAPPEQMGKLPGVHPGPFSDIYSFARTCCYTMFKATELRRKQWESLPAPLADLLEECLDPSPKQRPGDFEKVLSVLGEFLRAGEETRLREQQEQLRQEQDKEQQRQREGEEQLRRLVCAALERTGGKPTAEDTAAARELCGRHKLSGEQANAVIREAKEEWRRKREEQERDLAKEQRRKREEEESRKQRRQEEAKEEVARGEASMKAERFDEALAAANRALELDSGFGAAYALRAQANAALGNQDQAFRDANKAVEIAPREPRAYSARGMVFLFRKEGPQAQADFDQAIRLDPRSHLAHVCRGLLFHLMGDQERAIADLTTAIKLDGADPDGYRGRADCYLAKGEYNLAIRDATAALKIDSSNAATWYTRAEAHRLSSHFDQAIADANQAIGLSSNQAEYYFTRSEALRGKGEWNRAIEDATVAIHLAPNQAQAYGARAAAHLGKGDYEQAVTDANKALELNPEDEFAKGILDQALQMQSGSDVLDALPGDEEIALGDGDEEVEFELSLDDSPSATALPVGAPETLPDRIMQVLQGYAADGIYLAPNIPLKKLENACAAAAVPGDEVIRALIDCTIFGSASDCLVFGSRGFYYHNMGGNQPDPGYVGYDEFPQIRFSTAWLNCITLGGDRYCNKAGSNMSRDKIIEMLTNIRQAVIKMRGRS
jgi:tetratricopeptide (TPR) repeat protein